MIRDKIKKIDTLKKLLPSLRKRNKKIVFTNGCFDILHRGHIELLEKAKKLGDVLIVAINSDDSVKRLKGPRRPINTRPDRAKVLAALEAVDYVIWFPEADPANIIKELKPDILVKGADWDTGKIIGKEFIESYGGRVESIPYLEGYSTDSLIKTISKKFSAKQ